MVLQNYMGAWLPKLTKWNGRVLFIDAFAGPGEYSRGEQGSPVIALRALIDHPAKSRITSEVMYLFIEKDNRRYEHLDRVLDRMKDELPSYCRYRVINSTFDDTLTTVLDALDQQNAELAPCFVMIDPFGISETPMSTIGRILKNPSSEVYVSLMYREMNRFLGHPSFAPHLDDLFGCRDWRAAMSITEPTSRRRFLFGLYRDQLKVRGAKHVVRFDLHEKSELVYSIFFGTQHPEGCDKMKEAIWKVDPFGDFKFRGGAARSAHARQECHCGY